MILSFRSASSRIALTAALFLPLPAWAQAGQMVAAPISQLELRDSDAGRALAAAMSALAEEPRNLDALLSAGEAALKLEDPRSAVGFFGRADDVSPNNGRVKAGLGRSMLVMGQVGDGLRLMEQATTLGYSDAALLADRGLARDLTGNQQGAQRDYAAAVQGDPNNAMLIRRYAVSLGISGQVDRAEKVIEPLLYKNDRGAWRDRAFILAMNGRTQDALSITGRVMPKALADAIKPYMERMAMLTPGQRAAAVHLGQFPEGLVNVRITSAAVPARASVVAMAEPSDKKGRKKESRQDKKQARADSLGPNAGEAKAIGLAAAMPPPPPPSAAPSVPVPASVPASAPLRPVQPVARALPKSEPAAVGGYEPVRIATTPSSPRPVQGPPALPRPDAAATALTAPVASTPRPSAPPPAPVPVRTEVAVAATTSPASAAAPGESTRSLADIIADIEIPDAERRQDVAPVNLAEIAAMQAAERKAREAAAVKARKEEAKRKAEAEAKAKAEAEKKRLAANPARYWVQIGAGRDTNALAFTLRRMKKDHSVLARQDGWWADYGRTKRLVVGPFPNLARANAVEADLKKDGSDAFVWRSEAGEDVERLGGQ